MSDDPPRRIFSDGQELELSIDKATGAPKKIAGRYIYSPPPNSEGRRRLDEAMLGAFFQSWLNGWRPDGWTPEDEESNSRMNETASWWAKRDRRSNDQTG